jgi:NAD(P)-dependent dehydrogenase (short-subunit alcohol dehydrogenase family)
LLINNAGVDTGTPTLGDEAGLREELEVNYLGPVAVSRAFAPVLGANGGGALINMLSGLAWLALPAKGGYSSAKAAMWAATNSLRLNLLDQGTLVTAVHAGYIDTDMAAAIDGPKTAPRPWPRRPSRPSRPASTRCSPTSRHVGSAPRCPAR